MRVEVLPGMTNVVRFPVERRARPTLELLREIAPDVRVVPHIGTCSAWRCRSRTCASG